MKMCVRISQVISLEKKIPLRVTKQVHKKKRPPHTQVERNFFSLSVKIVSVVVVKGVCVCDAGVIKRRKFFVTTHIPKIVFKF